MKKILLLIIFILTSFSLFSCEKDSPVMFQTPYKDIFKHFEKKQYNFSIEEEEKFSEKLNEESSYNITYTSSKNYTISLKIKNNIYKEKFKDEFGDIFIIDNVIYMIHFSNLSNLSTKDSLIISKFVDNKFEDILALEGVQSGLAELKKEDDSYYLYYFNSMSSFLTLTKIDLEFKEFTSTLITKGSYIRNLYIKNHNDFYFIDGTSTYHVNLKDNDIKIDFVASETTYMYKSLTDLLLFEVKATSYIVNTNLILRETDVKNKDEKLQLDTREIYNVSYNLRSFDYICYKDKILYIFKEFLGIIEYDINTGQFYGYYNYYENVEGFYFSKDTLLLQLANKDYYYKLDLNSI